MKRLFWIGSPFFVRELEECGWEVCAHNFEQAAVFGWGDIVAKAGWEPDVVVVSDKSRPPFVLGMENFPCLTVFYCVDSHIHSWYPFYAQGFDVCLMSLQDHIPSMLGKVLPEERVWWSPAFSQSLDAPRPYAPEWDVLFVGNVSESRTPGRFRFLRELASSVEGVQVMQGNYRNLYHKARLVLNYCELGDLNFRVFETLGCGACLVTPDIGQGQQELFSDGRDLLLYTPDDVTDATRVIRKALADDVLCRSIAQHGLDAVNAAHKAIHRAKVFSERIRALNVAVVLSERRARVDEIRKRYLHMLYLLLAEQEESTVLQSAYVRAAKLASGK